MTVFILSLGLTGDSKAGFVDIILNVLKKEKDQSGSKAFYFLLFFYFFIFLFEHRRHVRPHGNKMIKTLKVLSEIQARSIFSFRTFPVVNPQVFPVYRTSYHTTKPAIWKERKKEIRVFSAPILKSLSAD